MAKLYAWHSHPCTSLRRLESSFRSSIACAPTHSRRSSCTRNTSLLSLFKTPNPAPNNDGDEQEVSSLQKRVIDTRAGLASIAATVLLLINSVQIVDTGEIAIVSKLGELSQLNPGLHVVAPLISRVDYLSTKTTLLEQSNFVPTKEGLTVELDTAILYRLAPDSATSLYGSVGRGYRDKLIAPEASSAVRGLTSESEAKALYTSGRTEIQNKLKSELRNNLSPRGIVIEDVLLKAVILPKDLSASIEEKARAEQESARMEFVLKKETQEAQRKAIEAEGIAEFQNIVSKGITPSLLQWKGIEATEKIAESPNSKVIIIGNNKGLLPVILGNDK